jgi:hypothetical protein
MSNLELRLEKKEQNRQQIRNFKKGLIRMLLIILVGFPLLSIFSLFSWRTQPPPFLKIDHRRYAIIQTSTYGGYMVPVGQSGKESAQDSIPQR